MLPAWERAPACERTDLSPFATMGECGGLERTDFNSFYTFGRCECLEGTDF